jgi:hypothetical protein
VSFGSRSNCLGDEQKTRHQCVGPQPDDAVQVDETVQVPQDFINETEFKAIDVGVDYKSVPGCGRHLIKPSELAVVFIQRAVIEIVLSPDLPNSSGINSNF